MITVDKIVTNKVSKLVIDCLKFCTEICSVKKPFLKSEWETALKKEETKHVVKVAKTTVKRAFFIFCEKGEFEPFQMLKKPFLREV